MGRGKKFLNQVKTIFGRKSSLAERPLENNVSVPQSNVLIAPGQLPGVGAHVSKPGFPREGNGRGTQTTRAGSAGSGDDSVAPIAPHFYGERIMDNTENTAAANRLATGHFPSESTTIHGVSNSGVSIGGGTVNVHNVTGTLIQNKNTIRPGLEALEKRFTASAFHNSFQRIDPPRCHPDTRVAIQKKIYDWILMDHLIRKEWIMWMHGAAGAGKSAIMQSLAELCEKAQIPLASFFFVRVDSTRNSMGSFIATLVYQLIQIIPQTREEIYGIIENNPRIFDQSLESQLQKLFIQPLLRVQQHFKGFFVVFIDGLDECIERARQSELIKLLGTVSHSRIPVIFLLASRREPQIEAEFVRKPVREILQTLPLDSSDIEQTSEDIRRFLVDKFSDIKEAHLLKHHLPIDWPAASMVEEIVDKASGQFIFASVVINYLSSPRANPAHQLEVIRGIRPRDSSSQNPFEHLDALYKYIFSQVETLGKVFEIIAFVLLLPSSLVSLSIQQVFLLEDGELDVLFADLTAIILCEQQPHTKKHPKFKFLHASLPDFLLDKSRSEIYYIDLDKYRTKLLCLLLKRIPPTLDPFWSADDLYRVMDQERRRLNVILCLLQKEVKASDQLCSSFMSFNPTFYTEIFLDNPWLDIGANIIECLKQMDFSDQGKAYRYVVDMFAIEYAKYWPLLNDEKKDEIKRRSPDLIIRIDHIRKQAT